MKIFFTGASSFSGYWFVQALVKKGHDVHAVFTKKELNDYSEEGFYRQRVSRLLNLVNPIWNSSLGQDTFFEALQNHSWDAICLHGAAVSNHKSAAFPVMESLATNINGYQDFLKLMPEIGNPHIVATGTYFEANEGTGSERLDNFSPYALSKRLTWDYMEFFAQETTAKLSKFVMPNPFGEFESKGFTSYLVKNWMNGLVPSVRTPDYVRDNIPVSLLAKCYEGFVSSLGPESVASKFNPSGFVSSQGEFAQRFANEMLPRLKIPCPLEFMKQVDWNEPRIRINCDSAFKFCPDWNQTQFWDGLASWYLEEFASDNS